MALLHENLKEDFHSPWNSGMRGDSEAQTVIERAKDAGYASVKCRKSESSGRLKQNQDREGD